MSHRCPLTDRNCARDAKVFVQFCSISWTIGDRGTTSRRSRSSFDLSFPLSILNGPLHTVSRDVKLSPQLGDHFLSWVAPIHFAGRLKFYCGAISCFNPLSLRCRKANGSSVLMDSPATIAVTCLSTDQTYILGNWDAAA